MSDRFIEKYFLTEEHEMVRDLARDFAQKEIAPRAEMLDAHDAEFPTELMKKAADLGFLGITMPEEYGGMGLDSISQMIVVEEISKASAGFGACMHAHSGLGLITLYLGGTEEQKKTWLAEAICGEKFCSFALTEPDSGSDSGALKTQAVLNGDRWVLNGSKAWITNLTSGGFFVVAARTDPTAKGSHGISVFYVDSHSKGLTIGKPERKCGNRCSSSGMLYFDDCSISKDCLIGEVNQGFPLMMKGIDKGRLGIAAISLGIAQDCYDRSVKYANERVQFGKPIGKHQSIAFYLADMSMEIDMARTMLYNACRMKDAGMDYVAEAAAVKLFASHMCVRVAEQAVQIHGGNGYSEEYVVERHWRDSKLQTIGEGTSEICKIVLSRRCLAGQY